MTHLYDIINPGQLAQGVADKLINARESGDGLTILNYSDAAMYTPGAWDNPAVRACRGLIHDTAGTVLTASAPGSPQMWHMSDAARMRALRVRIAADLSRAGMMQSPSSFRRSVGRPIVARHRRAVRGAIGPLIYLTLPPIGS